MIRVRLSLSPLLLALLAFLTLKQRHFLAPGHLVIHRDILIATLGVSLCI